MDIKQKFEEAYRHIEKSEVVVIKDIYDYASFYGKDIVSKFLTVIVCRSGHARLLYDMQEVNFSANSVAVVLPEHIMRPMESSTDYDVTFVLHSETFRQDMSKRRMTHDKNKFHQLPSCHLSEDEMVQYSKAVDILEHISQASVTRYPNRHEMLLAQTDIMTELLDACRRDLDNESRVMSHNQIIFHDFCNLLATNYREQHEVAFYAEKARLTPRHFSVIIKEEIGLSASDYIEQYLATQAMNLLSARPDLSVQQIGYHLGYADSPSFCRFFKRLTGKNPTTFRQLKNR